MKISVSILDASFKHLQSEIDSVANADRIHLDIMDGHYVPNLSFGASILKDIRFPIPTETHLMVNNPEEFFQEFIALKTERIGFHIENTGPHKALVLLKYLKEKNIQSSIALDGYTKEDWLTSEILDTTDHILLLSVKSGFGGQDFLPHTLEKIKTLRQKGFQKEIQVDGGVNNTNIQAIKMAGANSVVIGSYLMKQKPEDRESIIKQLKGRELDPYFS